MEAPGNHQEVFAARTSPERTVRLDRLYDYLKAEAARALTLRLFDMLAPDRTLFIKIFLTGTPDAGFMAVAMNWWLICLDEKQMLALLSGIADSDIASIQQYRDPENNITFLEVRRN